MVYLNNGPPDCSENELEATCVKMDRYHKCKFEEKNKSQVDINITIPFILSF